MTKIRKTALAFGAACAIAFTGGLTVLNAFPADAATRAAGDRGYYGTKLAGQGTDYALATAFYDELVEMAKDPDGDGPELSTLRKGESHPVENTSIIAEATNYAGGSMTLIKQFGAALDCFRYDHPDLFYVNFDRLTVNVTAKSNPSEGGGGLDTESDSVPVPYEGDEETSTEYEVAIGAGRATSYLLFDAEKLNGKTDDGSDDTATQADGDKTLYADYLAKYNELIEKVNKELQPASGSEDSEEDINYNSFSVEKRVTAVNKVLGESFSYGFDNNYVNTTYFITETGNKPNASSEGFARLFKTIMHTVGVDDCLIVSGYYVVDGTAKACTWNYVKDGGKWYGVDVANNLTSNNKYLCATGDVFFLNHFENRVVSLSNYQLKYPEITEFAYENYNVVTGELQVANGTLENRNCIVVADHEGIFIRVKGEDGNFGAWIALSAYESDSYYEIPEVTQPDPGDGEDDNKEDVDENAASLLETREGEDGTEITVANCKVAHDATKGLYYLFDLKNGEYEIAIMDGDKVVEKNENVANSIDEKVVSIPLDGDNDLRLKAQPLKKTSVNIKFGSAVKISTGAEVIVDFTAGSLTGDELAFVKELCTIEDITLNGDTLSFNFTPCGLTKYSGLKYTFTFPNLVEDVENGTAAPASYSVVFKYEGESIRTSGVSVGSNLYTDIVTQPSLVFNNDLTLNSNWKYGGKDANNNMISALALSVGKISANEELTNAIKAAVAANNTIFKDNAFNVAAAPSTGEDEGDGGEEGDGSETPTEPVTPNTVEAYSLNLTLDGKAVTVPSGTYLKLSFPYPAEHGPEEGDGTVYKVFQFKNTAKGNIDYSSYEMLDVVAARQGLIVAVNDPSANFVIVAFDANKINDNTKIVLTETSGVGGKVSGNPVNKVTVAGRSYTITPDAGYVIDSVLVNGVEKIDEVTGGTFQLKDEDLSNKTYNVLRVEFKPAPVVDGEDVSADDYSVANGAAANFVQDQLQREGYSEAERNSIVTDYPIGGAIHAPKDPPITASTQLQIIIVLSVVGGIALIGAIAIIYCGAIRPKVLREREEEAARIAAQRERRANRNKGGSSYDSRRR